MNNELSIITDVINANDNSEEEVDFVHRWCPDADLDMMYHFNNINIGNCNVYAVIEQNNAFVRSQLDGTDVLKLD